MRVVVRRRHPVLVEVVRMYRAISLAVVIGGVVLIGVIAYGSYLVIAPRMERTRRRWEAEDRRRAELEEWNQRQALRTLDRTAERIERDQENYYTDRARQEEQ